MQQLYKYYESLSEFKYQQLTKFSCSFSGALLILRLGRHFKRCKKWSRIDVATIKLALIRKEEFAIVAL